MFISDKYFPMTRVIEVIKGLSDVEEECWESTSDIVFILLED